MIDYSSKLHDTEVSIFAKVSQLAKENSAINLGQGYPNFDCDDALKELITYFLNKGKNQYCAMAGLLELRESIADKIFKEYECKIDAETNITITAGATQALFTSISAFVKMGDEVIVIEPAYDSYVPSIQVCGGIPICYALKGPDFKMDWSKFAALLNDKTRMVIINSPHNPIGKIFTEDDMLQLQNVLKGTNVILLSDEVYEHLVFDGNKHQSVLRFPDLFDRSLIVYSFGKTFHSTGWKIGYCIGPEHLMKEFRNVHQWNVFSVNSFIQYALAEYLKNPANYNHLSGFYQSKRDYFNTQMKSSRFKALGCEGTYFQLFDYSQISDLGDIKFNELLAREYGVVGIPVSVFYKEQFQNNVLRFCFAKTEDMLGQAAQLLCRV